MGLPCVGDRVSMSFCGTAFVQQFEQAQVEEVGTDVCVVERLLESACVRVSDGLPSDYCESAACLSLKSLYPTQHNRDSVAEHRHCRHAVNVQSSMQCILNYAYVGGFTRRSALHHHFVVILISYIPTTIGTPRATRLHEKVRINAVVFGRCVSIQWTVIIGKCDVSVVRPLTSNWS